MYKFSTSPSPLASAVELADFLEVECLRQPDENASISDVLRNIGRLAEDFEGEQEAQDEHQSGLVADVCLELHARARSTTAAHHAYPFAFDPTRQVLRLNPVGEDGLYVFMLVASRSDMGANRRSNGVDGTAVFEQVCCQTAGCYWGARAVTFLFGTSSVVQRNRTGRFRQNVTKLCEMLGEGGGLREVAGRPLTSGDAGVDVVVWKPFGDVQPGKLIGFGQCKTGLNWQDEICHTRPDVFIKKWFHARAIAVDPIRLFFTTARVPSAKIEDACLEGGIIFERCRILDFAPEMPELQTQWANWCRPHLNRLRRK